MPRPFRLSPRPLSAFVRLPTRVVRTAGGLMLAAAALAVVLSARASGVLVPALARVRDRWAQRPGARRRWLRGLSQVALPSLYERHPEARHAHPRERGLRSIPVDEVVGTAVGGPTQRGGDFLPLKPFRSTNWASRWQRLLAAVDRMAVLPPIDVVRFGEGYWVLDGHNRMAAALYTGQVEIDANVTELVLPGMAATERPTEIAAALTGTDAVRSAAAGLRSLPRHEDRPLLPQAPGFDGGRDDQGSRASRPADGIPEPEDEAAAR